MTQAMIALTQEKRQKRINWLNDRISSMEQCRDEIPFGLSEYESMELSAYKDSLASLTAEPEHHVFKHPLGKLFYSLVDESCKGHDDVYPVYAAPPVPEIKLPNELMNLVNAVEFYHAVKAENPDIETGMWNDAYDWIKKAAVDAAPVIKRLNGSGE